MGALYSAKRCFYFLGEIGHKVSKFPEGGLVMRGYVDAPALRVLLLYVADQLAEGLVG